MHGLKTVNIYLEAFAEILGAEEKVFKTESRMKLVCQLRNSTSTPDFIFW